MASDESNSDAKPDPASLAEPERAHKALRLLDDSFEEWVHVGTGRGSGIVGNILLAAGGLLLGAGTYAMTQITGGLWHDRAPYLLVGGLVLEVGFLLFGGRTTVTVRVGDLGVALEDGGKLRRLAWFEIRRLSFADGQLELETQDAPMRIPVAANPGAAARVIVEAMKRIPKRVAIDEDARGSIGAVHGGEPTAAEPPQVTQAVCRASGVPLTVERDVRMCGRCGALYHRDGVPRRCDECGRKLKAS